MNADAEARFLTAAIARGDEVAFRKLYDCYHRRILRLALVLARGDETLAQDAAQAVFVTAAAKLKRVDGEAHLWNWLAQVTRQQAAKIFHQRNRDGVVIGMEHLPEKAGITESDTALEQILDASLLAMDAEDRQLIEQFYFEGLSQKEIAEQLQTTPKAVSSRLERARQTLRGVIAQKMSYES